MAAVYASPIERTQQTAAHIAAHHESRSRRCDGVIEADYGDWTGGSIAELAKTDLWKTVQRAPSRARFPNGESIAEMQSRTVPRSKVSSPTTPARSSWWCRTRIRSSR